MLPRWTLRIIVHHACRSNALSSVLSVYCSSLFSHGPFAKFAHYFILHRYLRLIVVNHRYTVGNYFTSVNAHCWKLTRNIALLIISDFDEVCYVGGILKNIQYTKFMSEGVETVLEFKAGKTYLVQFLRRKC